MYLYNRINGLEGCVYVENPSYGLLGLGSSLEEIAQHLTPPQVTGICSRLEVGPNEMGAVEVTKTHWTLQEYGRN